MAINFPSAPAVNDLYTENGITYEWTGAVWNRVPSDWINDGSFLYYDGALNVGVGTQTPSSKFQVAGTFNATGVSTFDDNLIVDTDTLFVNVTNDRVGINTSAPTEALDVDGNVTISRVDSPTLRLETTSISSQQSNLIMQGARTTTSAVIARHQYINNLSGGAVTSVNIEVDGDGHFNFTTGAPRVLDNVVWHAGNDGSGSGLDADTVDGIQASSFVRGDTTDNGTVSIEVTDADFIVRDSTDGTSNFIWRDFSASRLFLGTGNAVPATRQDLIRDTGEVYWHEGNDGPGSGLDADTVDGLEAGNFLRSNAQDTLLLDDTVANAAYNGLTIDYNLSGADTLTANRTHTGLRIDIDSNASGGGTASGTEHRIYGVYTTLNVAGDSDLAYTEYNLAESDHTTGTITNLIASYNYARTTSIGTVSNVYGTFSLAQANSGGTTVPAMYGVHARADVQASQTVTTARGVYGEVELDGNATTARAFEAIIDFNGGGVTNSYLFFGDTQGTQVGNVWGVYLNDLNNSCMGPITVGALNVQPAVGLDVRTTDAIQLASGTTAQRPAATDGMVRYNTDLDDIEGVVNGTWTSLSDTGSAGVGDTILPSADNVGTIGDASFTWNSGRFTTFQVDGVLTVRNRIDLADLDRIDFGSSDDAELFYNGTTNIFNLELESAATAFQITDNGTTRFTFTKSTGNLTATSFTGDGAAITNVDAATLGGNPSSYYQADLFDQRFIELALNQSTAGNTYIDFHTSGLGDDYNARILRGSGTNGDLLFEQIGTGVMRFNGGSSFQRNGNVIWHAGNDGAGSGLDADTLDGIQGSAFLRSNAADTATGTISFNNGINIDGAINEEIFTITGTTEALDPGNGTIQTHTLTGNTTYTDSLANGESMLLMIDDGANRTVSWPGSMVWVNNGGSPPTLATTGFTVISLWHVGGVLYGALVGDGS